MMEIIMRNTKNKQCMRCGEESKLYLLRAEFPMHEICHNCAMEYHRQHKELVEFFMKQPSVNLINEKDLP